MKAKVTATGSPKKTTNPFLEIVRSLDFSEIKYALYSLLLLVFFLVVVTSIFMYSVTPVVAVISILSGVFIVLGLIAGYAIVVQQSNSAYRRTLRFISSISRKADAQDLLDLKAAREFDRVIRILDFLPREESEAFLGDLEEKFWSRYQKHGKTHAVRWARMQALYAWMPFFSRTLSGIKKFGIVAWLAKVLGDVLTKIRF